MVADAWVLQALVDAKEEAVLALDRELRYLAFNRAHAEGACSPCTARRSSWAAG